MTGWVKLFRKSTDSMAFQNEGLWKVWTWCLMKASHAECWVCIRTGKGKTEVKINPGQFIFGRNIAAKELRMKPTTVSDRMQKLKKAKNIGIQPDTHYSIVTILNWDTYQNNQDETQHPIRQPTVNQPSTNRQPTHTFKNVKNVKNDKKQPPLPPPQGGDACLLYDFYIKTINPENKSRARAVVNTEHYLKKYPFEDLHTSISNYAKRISSKGIARQYRKDPANFFGRKDPFFLDYVPGVFDACQFDGGQEDDIRSRHERVRALIDGDGKLGKAK